MRVLGIDPGTATTGYGLVIESDSGDLQAETYGVITTPANQEMPDRLKDLYQQIEQLILLHRPEQSAVEKLYFQRNVTTALSVGQARGVILLAFANHGVPVAEYTPLEIKQAATGYGAADKQQVQSMIKSLLHLEQLPRPDDAADALAVAICHLNSHRLKQLGVS
jgi:crossover junction endodeoxyribonuclease RuvC